MRHFKTIVPVSTDQYNKGILEEIKRNYNLDSEIKVTVDSLEKGPVSVECEYDCTLSAPHVVAAARDAERKGCDGIVVYCFDDPGVNACKEVLSIPVVGAGEAAVIMAALVGKKFSILLTVENSVEVTRAVVERLNLLSSLVSIRTIDIPVIELSNQADLNERLLESALAAVNQDLADTIVLGCTGMVGVAEYIEKGLLDALGYFIPVLEPGACSLHLLRALVSMNCRQSKRVYMEPPEKERKF